MKSHRLQPEEIEYIRKNCLTKSDEEMARYLNRHLKTIIGARRKLGINKKSAGKIDSLENANPNAAIAQAQASYQLTETERKEYFKTQFVNSLYYTNLKEQFTKEEIDFYLEEWGSLCLQFEDIVATEKRQIDEYIKMTLMGFRILRNINAIEEEIKQIEREIAELRRKYPNIEKDPMAEEARERDSALMSLVMTMNGQSKSMSIDYQRNLEMRTKLLGELNARRKDRLDQITKRDKTFLGFIQEFRDRQVRETQGRRLELMRQAKEKKKDEWHKSITYIDGTKDCILLDEYAELPQTEIVYLENKVCKTMTDFSQKKDAKILVVDDDSRRLQFFSEVFKDNDLEFVSNAEKAINKLNSEKYDLICLDYDLGLEQKGTAVVEHILDKNASPDSRILVHSMNKAGAREMAARLKNHRSVEAYPFEDLVKLIGDKNATISISSGTNESHSTNDTQG
jgi:CheY-like chemotaxis protein